MLKQNFNHFFKIHHFNFFYTHLTKFFKKEIPDFHFLLDLHHFQQNIHIIYSKIRTIHRPSEPGKIK